MHRGDWKKEGERPGRQVALFLATGVVLAIFSMGLHVGHAGVGENEARSQADATVAIVAKEFSFAPESVEISLGQTVEIKLRNRGVLAHNLTIENVGKKTKTIQSGNQDSVRFTPEEAGEYRFYCAVPGHRDAGMAGTILVKEE